VFNEGKLEAARDIVADDIENTEPNGTIHGWDAFFQYISTFKNAMPDARITPKRFVESGNTVVTEGTFSGTFTSPLQTRCRSWPRSACSSKGPATP
jgi:predicted ester cyclase